MRCFGLRMKYIVGKITGMQQNVTKTQISALSMLNQHCLEPTTRYRIRLKFIPNKNIPVKLIKFLFLLKVLNDMIEDFLSSNNVGFLWLALSLGSCIDFKDSTIEMLSSFFNVIDRSSTSMASITLHYVATERVMHL